MSSVQFNYYCLNDDCSSRKMIHIVKEKEHWEEQELCSQCNQPLKLMGQKSVSYIGSREGQYKKLQSEIRTKAKNHDALPEIQLQKKQRGQQESSNLKSGSHESE